MAKKDVVVEQDGIGIRVRGTGPVTQRQVNEIVDEIERLAALIQGKPTSTDGK